MSLEIVFLPLVLLQALVLADNFRYGCVLFHGDSSGITVVTVVTWHIRCKTMHYGS